VPECDLETSTLRQPGPIRAVAPQKQKVVMGQNRFSLSISDFRSSIQKVWVRLSYVMVRQY